LRRTGEDGSDDRIGFMPDEECLDAIDAGINIGSKGQHGTSKR